jgi:hypothetical protein
MDFGQFPFCPHDYIRGANASRFRPVVYFIDKSGNKRFPGNDSEKPPKGFERAELRTISEVRKFEKDMNRTERERWDRHKIREEMTFGPMRQQSRSELITMMKSFSNLGKDFARTAMKNNDEKRRGDFDANFHVEIFS